MERVETQAQADTANAESEEDVKEFGEPMRHVVGTSWEEVVAYYADSPIDTQYLRETHPERFR